MIRYAAGGGLFMVAESAVGSCGLATVVGWAVWGVAACSWGNAQPLPADEDRPRHWRRWTLGVVALSLALATVPGIHRCPHATTLFIGGVGISHSTTGGPCRNEPHNGGRQLFGDFYLAWRLRGR